MLVLGLLQILWYHLVSGMDRYHVQTFSPCVERATVSLLTIIFLVESIYVVILLEIEEVYRPILLYIYPFILSGLFIPRQEKGESDYKLITYPAKTWMFP